MAIGTTIGTTASGQKVRFSGFAGIGRGHIKEGTRDALSEMAVRLMECPPARKYFVKFELAMEEKEVGVLGLACAKCGPIWCKCGDGMERSAQLMAALYEDPIIREVIFDPLGIVVYT